MHINLLLAPIFLTTSQGFEKSLVGWWGCRIPCLSIITLLVFKLVCPHWTLILWSKCASRGGFNECRDGGSGYEFFFLLVFCIRASHPSLKEDIRALPLGTWRMDLPDPVCSQWCIRSGLLSWIESVHLVRMPLPKAQLYSVIPWLRCLHASWHLRNIPKS